MNEKYDKVIRELEEFAKRKLEIPFCNFNGINPLLAREIIIGLCQMYKEYPFFKNVLCAIESLEEFRNRLNLLNFSNKKMMPIDETLYEDLEETMKKTKPIYGFSNVYDSPFEYYDLPLYKNDNFADYFSFVIYENARKYKKEDLKDDLGIDRRGLYHEFGHLLDTFLHISNSKEFMYIIKNHNIEKEISKYACKNNKEIFAEAFSYYNLYKLDKRNVKMTLLIELIGKLADRKYKEFTRFRKIKFINNRYNFNKKFSMQKNFQFNNKKQKSL